MSIIMHATCLLAMSGAAAALHAGHQLPWKPLAALRASARRFEKPAGTSLRSAPAGSSHSWPCKNGDLQRTGTSRFVGPQDLGKPMWEWSVPGHNMTHGHIETTPLIDGHGNIYIGTTTGGIYALRSDGTELWHHMETPAKQVYPARVLTGSLDGNSLYIPTSDGIALSFDLATGKQNWRKKYAPIAGFDAWSATVSDGVVVLAGCKEWPFLGNEFITALDAKDGSEKWVFKPHKNVYNFMPVAHDGKLLFMDFQGDIYCLLLSNGKLQWKREASDDHDRFRFTTAGLTLGSNGLLYTMFNNEAASGGVLRAYDVKTGSHRWSKSFEQEASAAPVVGHLVPNGPLAVVAGFGKNLGPYKELLQDGQAFVKAFDADTGAEMWSFTTPPKMLHGAAGVNSTPGEDSIPDALSNAAIGADGTVYIGWEGGKQFALEGATGKMISEHFNGYGEQGEPAISDDLVVFPSIGKLVAFSDSKERDYVKSSSLTNCAAWLFLTMSLTLFEI